MEWQDALEDIGTAGPMAEPLGSEGDGRTSSASGCSGNVPDQLATRVVGFFRNPEPRNGPSRDDSTSIGLAHSASSFCTRLRRVLTGHRLMDPATT
jgi:hypothetical protein